MTFTKQLPNGKVVPLSASEAAGLVAGMAEEGKHERLLKRKNATLSIARFANAAVDHDLITEAEAIAWVTKKALPTYVTDALAGIPDPSERRLATLTVWGATEVRRLDPTILRLQAVLQMPDEDLDHMFGITG